MPHTIQSLLTHDKAALEAALGLDASSARIEVQCLLQAVLQVNRAYLLTHPEQILGAGQQAHYTTLLKRRLSGEPIAYLLGEREFYGLTFRVTPATLIPRPDTELLVELALQRIPQPSPQPSPCTRRGHPRRERQQSCSHWRDGRGSLFRVLDLGTGSGAIALSIAHARPDVEVTAVDASQEALDVARKNARRLNISSARLLHSDWFEALAGGRLGPIGSPPPPHFGNE